ncbi:protein of unknown function [Legionella fallonii LLAP-10]|uniref:Uncharacterized protein n=1 Tax=Legionella fallonii LLAP-10 TaxID=1212491 RepID=A0A098G232_9GAMM|nr:protein of unknown function [Legionella fallonii LLAP-10]
MLISQAHDKYPSVPVDLINAVIVQESNGAWNAVSTADSLLTSTLTKTLNNHCYFIRCLK